MISMINFPRTDHHNGDKSSFSVMIRLTNTNVHTKQLHVQIHVRAHTHTHTYLCDTYCRKYCSANGSLKSLQVLLGSGHMVDLEVLTADRQTPLILAAAKVSAETGIVL